jgi:hypothetical protein
MVIAVPHLTQLQLPVTSCVCLRTQCIRARLAKISGE